MAISIDMGTMNTDAAIVPTKASDQGGLALASKARRRVVAGHVLMAPSGRAVSSQASSLLTEPGLREPYISPMNRPPPTLAVCLSQAVSIRAPTTVTIASRNDQKNARPA